MTEDESIEDVLGEMIVQIIRQHGIAVGDDRKLLDVMTDIHPHDRRAAGDDLLRALGRQGLSIRPNLTIEGSLSARMCGPLGDLFDPRFSAARLRAAAVDLDDDRPADGWWLDYEGPRL